MGEAASKPMVEVALRYAKYGWRVFPTKDKKPAVRGMGLRHATRDPETIRKWWAMEPDADISVATGPASNLYVVDLDVKNGLDGVAAWRAIFGDLPKTKFQTTPHNGLHLFFKYPEGRKLDEQGGLKLGRTVSKVGLGIDTVGEGGSVVMCPSPGYVFGPKDRELLPIPEALIEWFTRKPEPERKPTYKPTKKTGTAYARKTLDILITELLETPKGERNEKLNRVAFRLGTLTANGKMPTEAAEEIKAAARETGLEPREVETTFTSGYNSGLRKG